MPALSNGKREHFAQAVASGVKPIKAYVLAGYSKNGASQASQRLRKCVDVAARIAALTLAVEQQTIAGSVCSRSWILQNLQRNCVLALQLDADGRPGPTFNGSVANRALELLGKEHGMFRDSIDHTLKWDGDPSKLDEKQLATMVTTLEQVAARGIESPKPVTLDVTSEAVEETGPAAE